jgi:hypothetical protein
MKSSTVPLICGVSLAAMTSAGLSHWWSVRQTIAMVDAGIPIHATPHKSPAPVAEPVQEAAPAPIMAATPPKMQPSLHPEESQSQEKFYDALISKIENLQNQNRDLLDQVAETNRDLMKLEFRVDTHSEQFRPLPVNDERIDTSFEDDPGVLPPRAEPVQLPTHE